MEDALGQAHVAHLMKAEALNSINLIPSSILPGKLIIDQITFHTPEPLQQGSYLQEEKFMNRE